MKFLESFLPKLFITLIPSEAGLSLSGELRKNGVILKRFDTEMFTDTKVLQEKLKKFERESSLIYVAFLETEADQGVLNSCAMTEMDVSSIEKVCIDNRWGIYITKDDLFERQKAYRTVGLDLLFSPYSLLYNIYETTIKKSDGLYLMLANDFIICSVFKEGSLLFGKQVKMEVLTLLDDAASVESYVKQVQTLIKAFYDSKVDETMFIEKVFVADALNISIALENRLEDELFVDVEKESVDLAHELVLLSEKELV